MDQAQAPWQIDESAFPAAGAAADKLRFAVLAPSIHNTQPWLFRIADDWVDAYADRRRALPVVDLDDREPTMSCGAAIETLRVALAHFGLGYAVEELPDPDSPDLLAGVLLAAAGEGVRASYLNQPIEVPQLRPRLAAVSGVDQHPQLLLRLGYVPLTAPPAARRPLDEVLL